jgi:hypothetical protein
LWLRHGRVGALCLDSCREICLRPASSSRQRSDTFTVERAAAVPGALGMAVRSPRLATWPTIEENPMSNTKTVPGENDDTHEDM